MIETIKWTISSISNDFLQVIYFILFYFVFRQLKQLKDLMTVIKGNYEEHIAQSTSSDRENLRSNLRKLYIEIDCTMQSGKKISEPVIEEFFSSYDLYVRLGGNGYIKHMKEDVECWLEDQRLKRGE